MSTVPKNRFSKAFLSFVITSVMCLAFTTGSFAQDDAAAGEKLFNANCASCHAPDKKVVGPALQGAQTRWEDNSSKEALYEWVRNSQALIKKGDGYAVQLFDENNSQIMTAFPALTDADIDNIFTYVEGYVPPQADGGSTAETGSEVVVEEDAGVPIYILLVILIVLVLLVRMLVLSNYHLKAVLAEKEGKEVPEREDMIKGALTWMGSHKKIVAIIVLIVAVLGTKDIAADLYQVGVYEGYQPEQPIKFSHKIHAGDDKIDCNYCHSSARNSKHAGIPSANVCMNCHRYISKGPSGTEEIAKIYDAVGWDPVKGAYTGEEKPIKWIKVHNLPDHVFFSHQQHVSVGKIQCQKCHGPVEEFTTGKQFAPLTMGWCVNCHRETKVQMEGSEYYDEIHARLPDNLKEQYMKDGVITVSELGGIECSKCHY